MQGYNVLPSFASGKDPIETLDQVNQPVTSLASPELYIIVNGKPTTNKMVWRSLVNVKDIKGAVREAQTNQLALQRRR